MFGTSTETLTQPQDFAQVFSNAPDTLNNDTLDNATAVEFNVPPNERTEELAPEYRKQLGELKASLARMEVPWAFSHKLEDHLTYSEKAKVSLHRAIKRGLSEAATVFSPKRYGRYDFSDHTEANLWLRTLWNNDKSADNVATAFELHLSEGRRFPTPADILALTTDENEVGSSVPAKPQRCANTKRRYY